MMKLVEVEVLSGYRVRLRYADGVEGDVDLSDVAGRGVFEAWNDRSFFEDLSKRFGAPGEFARAYVIAHEVGHHVQKLTGTFRKLEAAQGRVSQAEFNRISVRMELQADCYAGVWGYHAGTRNQLDPGDVEEALAAATAIGDDRLQQQSRGYVVPESFTHGSSAERRESFQRGFERGTLQSCDTFGQRRAALE